MPHVPGTLPNVSRGGLDVVTNVCQLLMLASLISLMPYSGGLPEGN